MLVGVLESFLRSFVDICFSSPSSVKDEMSTICNLYQQVLVAQTLTMEMTDGKKPLHLSPRRVKCVCVYAKMDRDTRHTHTEIK